MGKMFQAHCFPKEVIQQGVYFKLRFSLSYRDVEELLSIRAVLVDHATIQRWVYKFTPFIEATFRKRKKAVGESWRMDETYDKEGKTVDFLLTKRRNKFAAHKFLVKATGNKGYPKVITTNKSAAHKGAIKIYNRRTFSKIKIRQCKYLNNRVEADHRFIKWRTQNMLGFKSLESASRTLAGIETVGMIKKGQITFLRATAYTTFCSLAA